MSSQSPIGMFDSGLGGLTVLRASRALLPAEDFIYFGDTARLPYGNKSASIICRYADEISQFLFKKGIKLLVVACNTVSSYAMNQLQNTFTIPVIGVIEPAVKMALEHGKVRIGILGTRGTIASGSYQKMLLQLAPHLTLYPISCPLFVPLVEEGFLNHPILDQTIAYYLEPIKGKIDTLILGCTHYPLLFQAIQNYLGDTVRLINAAEATAQETQRVLGRHQLEQPIKTQKERINTSRYFVTDDPAHFTSHAKLFMPIEGIVEGVGCAMLL